MVGVVPISTVCLLTSMFRRGVVCVRVCVRVRVRVVRRG